MIFCLSLVQIFPWLKYFLSLVRTHCPGSEHWDFTPASGRTLWAWRLLVPVCSLELSRHHKEPEGLRAHCMWVMWMDPMWVSEADGIWENSGCDYPSVKNTGSKKAPRFLHWSYTFPLSQQNIFFQGSEQFSVRSMKKLVLLSKEFEFIFNLVIISL